MNTPATIYRKDYQPPHFLITETFLDVDIRLARTRVKSRLTMSRHGEHHEPLILNGQSLQLISVQLDGVDLTPEQYEVTDETLSITGLPAEFELAIEVEIQPKDNLSLEGLYCSNGMYCTQCEAEGFRRITYYLDRPDVLSVFTTRIEADSDQYPVLLSNGNQLAQESISSTRHAVTWHDPHPKPCYLFALVAGDLACKSDYFRTAEGRDVSIEFYVEPKDLDKLEHGVQSLKNAMRWDEETYGLSYDLDRYMIVAVSHFNMGAMENKGLNIFNTSCVLASPDTATDKGYQRVEGVIAHEYFHNWSGNRVTCRDWFQLSLKEGFTVFRDAQFSADMNSATIKRIEDVQLLKSMQFPEDAGPQAHPIRPDSYITIDNFYTMTVYEKGAEVIRMFSTLLGWPAFRAGSDLYFERHDGQAVTCDDFIQAMEDASGKDLSQFSRWYSQAGTPTVKVRDHYDAELQTYTLNLSQTTPATPGQAQKLPLVIPIRFGFLTAEGEPLVLATDSEAVEEDLLLLTEQEQTVVFTNVKQKPTPSLLRDFSAPVYLDYVYSNEQLANLMRHDENEYNRWQAGQAWAMNILQANICACATDPEAFSDYADVLADVLENDSVDLAVRAEMLSLPSIQQVLEKQSVMNPTATHEALTSFEQYLGGRLEALLLKPLQVVEEEPYALDAQSIAKRQYRNRCLSLLVAALPQKYAEAVENLYAKANNLTDRLMALKLAVHHGHDKREPLLQDFYASWKEEALVIDHWFAVQASQPRDEVISMINSLLGHDAFEWTNPNRVRSVVASFCRLNLSQFYREDGKGLELLAQTIGVIDAKNPQLAARLAGFFNDWGKLDEPLRGFAEKQIETLIDKGLSENCYEILSKSLSWYRSQD